MKNSKQKTLASPLLALLACGFLPTNLHAQEQKFASSAEAIETLKTDVRNNDRAALLTLFGPEFNQLVTGDEVQDAINTKTFAKAIAAGCKVVQDSDDKIELEVGPDRWPLPIPLIRVDGQWHFDTAAGKEELINRHIGKDELNAIGVCHAYVIAQEQYAEMNPNNTPVRTYAQHLKSIAGKKDGLYWPPAVNGPHSPFNALVAEAQEEGYVVHPRGTGRHPFHGYYFRVLTQQGPAAPGGQKDYVVNGNLTGGFALVAYPEHWNQSGIMTFIVAQDGKVYQRDLGEETDEMAHTMKQYNPSPEWTPVTDDGVDIAR